jgi:hypothetical protein
MRGFEENHPFTLKSMPQDGNAGALRGCPAALEIAQRGGVDRCLGGKIILAPAQKSAGGTALVRRHEE